MLDTFLDKTCTIRSTTYNSSSWEELKTFSNLYTDIKCQFYQTPAGISKSEWTSVDNSVLDEPVNTYICIIEGDKTGVKTWQEVIITDNLLGNLWTFSITNIESNVLDDNNKLIQLILKS